MIDKTMPDAIYHRRPELSSTQARDVLKSPHIYKFNKGVVKKPTLAMQVGSATHTKILGVGAEVVYYPPEHLTESGAVSTKAATRAWIEEHEAAGITLISTASEKLVNAMSEAVLADVEARAFLESFNPDGEREVSIFANVEGVECRARFDMYDGTRGGDLKTARDASPRAFNREVGQRGYHIQQQWYDDTHHAETGRPLELFKFLVVENVAPFSVAVYDLDFGWRQKASEDAKLARDTYRHCVARDEWPGYGASTLIAPTYIVMEGEDTEVSI